MTTKRWAAEAFKMLVWQLTFMSDGPEKDKLYKFLMESPPEVKRECIKQFGKIPGL